MTQWDKIIITVNLISCFTKIIESTLEYEKPYQWVLLYNMGSSGTRKFLKVHVGMNAECALNASIKV